jgi:hypothetical protein
MTQRKVLSLGDFRGVDFSSSPLNVKPYRAVEAVNFINDYGKTRKRPGWRERLAIEEDGQPVRINGIFNYENGNHGDVIVHAGRRFYRLTVDAATGREIAEDITSSGTYAPSAVDPARLSDTRSQAIYNRKRLYIIGCGDYLVYGSWDGGESYELRRVYNNEDTYIPTTAIGIDALKTIYDDNEGTYEVLEDVSYTTSYRKNLLQGWNTYTQDNLSGGTDKKYTSTYYLDASIDEGSVVTVVNEKGERCCNSPGSNALLYTVGESTYRVGTIYFEEGKIDNGGSVLRPNDFWPEDNGDSLITVIFSHTPTAEEAGLDEADFVPYADRVGCCQFGTMFGVSGNTDRLFVSGNKRLPNVDFFSEADDLTYFPDLNTVSMGSDAQAVVGYSRLSDNTLAIFKERVGGADASIFYRTGYTSEQYDEKGNLEKLLSIFPTTAGNIGEAVISRHASVDFGGDNLILSRNGVFGVVLADNVATAVRYTRERSRNVNARLIAEKDLSEAVGYSYNNRYYLAVNGHCYVADARYKISRHDDMDGSYQYEWWYWEGVPARVFSELGGALVFGTEGGMICEFDAIGAADMTDRTYHHFEAGDMAVDVAGNQLDYNATLPFVLTENDRVTITTRGVFALYTGEITHVDGERIYVGESAIMGIYEGETVYVDRVGESGLSAGVAYIIDDVDVGGCSFRLLSENGEAVMPGGVGFRLLIELSGRELYVTQAGASDFRVKTHADGKALTLTDYDGEVPLLPQASLCHREIIRAAWYTPVFDLGYPAREKSIHRLTMTAEPGIAGKLSFGFDTRRERHMREGGESRAFSFDSLSFRDFAFTTGFASSLTKRIFVRGFNYIQFRFVSEGDTDASIGAFEAEYSILSSKGGLR